MAERERRDSNPRFTPRFACEAVHRGTDDHALNRVERREQFPPATDAGLVEDRLQVILHRMSRDEQAFRNCACVEADDHRLLERASFVYDALYAWCGQQVTKGAA